MKYYIIYENLEMEVFEEQKAYKEGVKKAISSGRKYLCLVGDLVLFNKAGNIMAWGMTRVCLDDDLMTFTEKRAPGSEKDG